MTQAEIGSEPCEHDWSETDVYCEDCGSHTGWICEECYDVLDAVWDHEQIVELGLG